MDQTNNTREVDIILKRREGWVYSGKTRYPRLTMAMIYENKEFIGNIHVQQVLENNWYGNFNWKRCSLKRRLLKISTRIFCIPLMAFLTAFHPNNSWLVHQKESPVILFVDSSIMFIIFLFILTWENNIDRKTMNRGFPTTYAEPFVILFTFGYLWRTMRLLMLQGVARFFRFNWNIWELIMLIFLLITITCWIIAFLTYNIGPGNISIPRKDWPPLEPILIAESALVFAIFMAFLKILFLIQLHPIFGPLQMSLASMLKDCLRFIVVIIIFLVAFGVGVNNLYSYYEGMKYNGTDGESKKQGDSFISFWQTLLTLYWSMFGLSERSSAELVIENGNEHYLTEATGFILFTAFAFTMIIVVINMLIASLTNSYQRVQDNNMDEWAYGKTQVFLNHMDGILVIPVPFNMLFEWINDLRSFIQDMRNKNKKWHCSFFHGCFMADVHGEENEREYLSLMSEIRSRYFLKNCKLFSLGVPQISDDFCANDDDD
ncbi:short transient receptor potential channel 4-like [Planococcus citri]|uniref:short transient receptor potential channel 4-like n=1 Tax=Planococcus citri TaxID=170843 RepID=UPI0031F81D03